MSIQKERAFENEICEHLAAHDWLYAEGDAAKYDRTRALFPEDVLAWVQQAHPAAWSALEKNHGAGEALLTRVRDQLNARGTLEVLRQGIDGAEGAPPARAVPAGAGRERRDPGAPRRQPAARGARSSAATPPVAPPSARL